jgi:hypothetical protein
MKTVMRALLFASLLTAGMMVILSPSVLELIKVSITDPRWLRRIVSGLIAIVGVLGSEIAFVLVPATMSMGTRLLHHKGIAIVSILGFLGLAMLDWSWLAARIPFTNFGAISPLIISGVVYFIGYLLVSAIVPPLPPGMRHVPKAVRGYLHKDEKVLYRIQQTRIMNPITPHNLIATNQRLIVHKPENLGFTYKINDYRYVDIANFKIDRGLLFCTVSIKERFQGLDMIFENMPKQRAQKFAQIVTDQIYRTPASLPSGRSSPPSSDGGGQELNILRERLARGEITPQEFDNLRRLLGY